MPDIIPALNMQFTYQLTEEDYSQGFKIVCEPAWVRLGFRLGAVLYAAVALLWLGFRIEDPDNRSIQDFQPFIVLLTTWIGVMSVLPYLRRRAMRKQLQRTPSARVPITLTVSDRGLHFHSEYTDSVLSWPSFIKWREGDAIFAFFTGPKVVTIVPKRVFGAGDLEIFRDTVSRSIPES